MSRGPEISVVTNEVEHRRIRGCRVIFDKIQGRPTDLIPEKSLWVKELEELLPKAKSREKLAGLQGRAGFCKEAGSGITELGPTAVR